MDIRFKSMNNPETVGYVVARSHDLFDSCTGRGGAILNWGRQFQTYGDGVTQHTPLSQIDKANLADFLESLADYWLSSATEEEKALIVSEFRANDVPDRKTIKFFAGLRPPKEGGKRMYLNTGDLKVSTADSKRHDKRWEEITYSMEWMNGSARAVYIFLTWPNNNHDDVISRYRKYRHIHTIFREEDDSSWEEQPAKFCGLGDDWGTFFSLDSYYDTMASLIRSFTEHASAVYSINRRAEHKQWQEKQAEKKLAEETLAA